MVGRTPEYLGKKIEAYDVKMAMLYALIFPLIILTFAAFCAAAPRDCRLTNPGPHGFSRDSVCVHLGRGQQRLGLRGLNANWWYNVAMGWDMLIGAS
jgi:potassium-transporting ATPase potassium-binding subunit